MCSGGAGQGGRRGPGAPKSRSSILLLCFSSKNFPENMKAERSFQMIQAQEVLGSVSSSISGIANPRVKVSIIQTE